MGETGTTAKGQHRRQAVLDAAIRSLGEHGYAATSLARVAELAGVQKRMVLYYFASREQLIATVLENVAGSFLDELDTIIAAGLGPDELLDALLDAGLAQLRNRPLIAAYFGLVAESATDPALHVTLEAIRARAQELGLRAAEALSSGTRTLSASPELLVLAARVAAHGIGLELLLEGPEVELERALALARASAPLLIFE